MIDGTGLWFPVLASAHIFGRNAKPVRAPGTLHFCLDMSTPAGFHQNSHPASLVCFPAITNSKLQTQHCSLSGIRGMDLLIPAQWHQIAQTGGGRSDADSVWCAPCEYTMEKAQISPPQSMSLSCRSQAVRRRESCIACNMHARSRRSPNAEVYSMAPQHLVKESSSPVEYTK
eukprot:647285-Pelagomonas_calceolata.AAC.3